MRSSTRHGPSSQARGVPVLGICRGFQAINAFSGGTLLQHVDGHQGPRWGKGPALDPPAPHRARAPGSPGSSSRPTPAAASSSASTRITTRRSVPSDLAPGPRRERLGEQPGRRPGRGPRGRRRPVRVRAPVPPGAAGVDAARLRAAVRRLRRRRARTGRPPLTDRSGVGRRLDAASIDRPWRREECAARRVDNGISSRAWVSRRSGRTDRSAASGAGRAAG